MKWFKINQLKPNQLQIIIINISIPVTVFQFYNFVSIYF
jgi:hypothetical protein